jgi:hypothetical protein
MKRQALAMLTILVVLLSSAVPSYAFHGGWWIPGAVLGGLALGTALAYPYYAYPYPPYAYPYYPPPAVVQAPPITAQPTVQREVIYPNGKYVLYGDGVTQAWQWVWVPAAPPLPPPPQQ